MQGKIVQYCRPKKVQLVTLGCSKNRVDSEHLLRQMASEGIEIVDAGYELSSRSKVDAVILNTCGFIKDAKEESIEAILAAVDAKEHGYVKHVFVFGCLSQRYMDELVEEIPEVDGFFGAFDWDGILKAMGVMKNDALLQQRYLTTPKHYAYLKISEGCDRTCSYCAIPGIRGRHISVPMEELVEEARNLAAMGVRELIVIAQDTTYYGLDLYKRRALGDLLKLLCEVEGIEWIRIHYSYPDQFPDDVLEIMASNLKMCKYIDIPLQHSSTKILKMMRRSIDGPQTQAVIDRIREKVPGVVLRTTLIVGHPGEDRREFDKLLSFVGKNRFDRLGAFTYSEEEGTYGALHFKDSVRESTKQARYDELMELQSGISLECNEARVGNVERVIVDSFTDGVLVCRSQSESPEVDGEILIGKNGYGEFAPEKLIGKFVSAKIVGANEYDLLAEIVAVE
ncbi:MAG: 30S ribosomal protein S12 methylthiotransferase RimO [Bacteroidales bacterium]|nr:30S ribosomal protein S12 methylthiotransferase RimO [Bacteroidales bacterium]